MMRCFSLCAVLLLPVLLLVPSGTTTTAAAAFVIQSPSSSCTAATATAVKIHNPIIAPNGGGSSSRIAGGVPSTILTRMNAINKGGDGEYNNGENSNDDDDNIMLDVPVFALKLAVVLTVKVVKDLVNYPPMLFEQVLQQQQHQQQKLNDGGSNSNGNGNSDDIIISNNNNSINSVDQQMSPLVMLAKFCGVLVFKGVHDAFYFPMVWTQDIATDVERAALSFRSSSGMLGNEYRLRYGAPPPEAAATVYLASLWIENLCGMVRDHYHSNDLFFSLKNE